MLEFFVARDGTKTLYFPELNETYHSRHGAISESRHVYIQEGLAKIDKDKITVFELGFGTGLNAILSLEYAHKNNKKIEYHSVEKFPLDWETIKELAYTDHVEIEDAEKYYRQMHVCVSGIAVEISDYFSIIKYNSPLLEAQLPTIKVDVVYFDAFAPKKQPELWTKEVFLHLKSFMHKDSILVTYCAQGAFRRTIKEAGYAIKRLKGPPFKKEMTLAYFE